VADLKAEIQAKSEVEKERQRLIYSGRLLFALTPYSQLTAQERCSKTRMRFKSTRSRCVVPAYTDQ
jgi:hypothetical protein